MSTTNISPQPQPGKVRLFPQALVDELDTRTYEKLDTHGVELAGALFHLVERGDALDRITSTLDAHLEAIRLSQRDPADVTWRRFRGMTEHQTHAFLDVLARATSDAVLQLRAIRDYENAIASTQRDQLDALERELVDRIAAARAEGAAEARRALEETPPASSAAPRSTTRPRSQRGGRRAA